MATDIYVTEISHRDHNTVYRHLNDPNFDPSQSSSPLSNDISMASTTLGPSSDDTEAVSVTASSRKSFQYDECVPTLDEFLR